MSNKEEKQTPKENKKKVVKKKKRYNLIGGIGINLIPPKTDTEIRVEQTKGKLNISAAVAILVIVVVSLGIVGFNIVSKLSLNNQKDALAVLEQKLNGRTSLIDSNTEMLARIDLYEEIKGATYSTKDVLEYWDAIIGEYGEFDKIELTSSLGFTVTGSGKSLTDVSKLWYLLGHDSRIKTINLESVSKSDNSVRFSFEGELNFDQFKSN